MDRRGTLGGFSEKLPEMLKCGSLMCGRLSLQLAKKLLMLLKALEICCFAASMGPVMALLMPFQTEVAVDLMLLKMELTVVFTALKTVDTFVFTPSTTVLMELLIPFQTVEVVLLMPFHTVDTVLLMVFITADTFAEMASQIVVKKPLMALSTVLKVLETALMALPTVVLMLFQMVVIVSPQFSQRNRHGSVMISQAASSRAPINWTPTLTAFLIVSQAFERVVVMPVQTSEKKVETLVHTSFQLVPNQPRMVSARPRIISTAAENTPVIPSQIPENTSFTPVQHCSQLPVNRPMNTSRSPVMTSITVPSTAEIAENAPSNTGASRLQKPSHRAFSTSVMFSKSKPRAFSLPTMP